MIICQRTLPNVDLKNNLENILDDRKEKNFMNNIMNYVTKIGPGDHFMNKVVSVVNFIASLVGVRNIRATSLKIISLEVIGIF